MQTGIAELLPGVRMTCLHSGKYNPGCLSLLLLLPVSRAGASCSALLPGVLLRSARSVFPYGTVSAECRRIGSSEAVGFTLRLDCTAPGSAVEAGIAFLGELLLRPDTRNGRFRKELVEAEKESCLAGLRSARTIPADLASSRLLEGMCGETGASLLGDETLLSKQNNQKLFLYFQQILPSCPILLGYSGSASSKLCERAWRQALLGLPRVGVRPFAPDSDFCEPQELVLLDGEADIPGEAAALGMRTNITLFNSAYSSLKLLAELFGVQMQIDPIGGIVTAAVPSETAAAALESLTARLDALRRGEFTPDEFDAAAERLRAELSSDDDAAQLRRALNLMPSGIVQEPETEVLLLSQVTPQQVSAAAANLIPDTAYLLHKTS